MEELEGGHGCLAREARVPQIEQGEALLARGSARAHQPLQRAVVLGLHVQEHEVLPHDQRIVGRQLVGPAVVGLGLVREVAVVVQVAAQHVLHLAVAGPELAGPLVQGGCNLGLADDLAVEGGREVGDAADTELGLLPHAAIEHRLPGPEVLDLERAGRAWLLARTQDGKAGVGKEQLKIGRHVSSWTEEVLPRPLALVAIQLWVQVKLERREIASPVLQCDDRGVVLPHCAGHHLRGRTLVELVKLLNTLAQGLCLVLRVDGHAEGCVEPELGTQGHGGDDRLVRRQVPDHPFVQLATVSLVPHHVAVHALALEEGQLSREDDKLGQLRKSRTGESDPPRSPATPSAPHASHAPEQDLQGPGCSSQCGECTEEGSAEDLQAADEAGQREEEDKLHQQKTVGEGLGVFSASARPRPGVPFRFCHPCKLPCALLGPAMLQHLAGRSNPSSGGCGGLVKAIGSGCAMCKVHNTCAAADNTTRKSGHPDKRPRSRKVIHTGGHGCLDCCPVNEVKDTHSEIEPRIERGLLPAFPQQIWVQLPNLCKE
mmetsp:Transcript_74627/g.241293  ORF Transcript_74627/g.241293 Transcript_74627/m.241293 type:complete len:544 (+) Transcript_74627:652-2283(+)